MYHEKFWRKIDEEKIKIFFVICLLLIVTGFNSLKVNADSQKLCPIIFDEYKNYTDFQRSLDGSSNVYINNNYIGGDTIKKILIFLLLGVSLFISSCNLYSNHNHTACEECSKCVDPECDGESSDKCLGHAPKHEHVACPECGLCINSECDGEEVDKCRGHTPKHEHVACPECGLCINSECDKEENKCLGHNKELYFIPIKERLLNFNIISDWLNSKYNEINEPYYDAYVKYENFYNILPNDYAKQKNMYLIETYTPIAFQLKSYKSLFIWNNGIINEIYKGKIKEIVHTAIIDSNNDGFDEILVSLNKNDNNSSIIIYDTKSNNYLAYDYTFKEVNENYLFFKSMDNQIAIYYNNKHDDETATTLYKNLIKNELVYKFNETEIFASSIEWDIYITIDEGNVNFPIFIDGTNLYFYTKTIMLYKGELFNYNKYLENRPGAKLIFMNDQLSSFKCNKTYNSDGVYHPDIVVENDEIIVESYYYEYKNGPRVLGDYELIFGFGATKNDQIIEKCLCINKQNLEIQDND